VCPSPTTFTQGNQTYTVTKPTTLTITSTYTCHGSETTSANASTDCPCTYSKPVTASSSSIPYPTGNYSMPSNVWTTATVSTYVTVCPTPTTFTAGPSTYTVTQPTTLTITSKFMWLESADINLIYSRLPLHHLLHDGACRHNHYKDGVNVHYLLPILHHYCD
jgi:hypothetical protein